MPRKSNYNMGAAVLMMTPKEILGFDLDVRNSDKTRYRTFGTNRCDSIPPFFGCRQTLVRT